MSPDQTQVPSCSTVAQSKVDPNIYVHYSINPEDVGFPFEVEMFTERTPDDVSRCHGHTIADLVATAESKYYWKDQKTFRDRGLGGYGGVDPAIGFANRVTELCEGSHTLQLMDDKTYQDFKSALPNETDSYTKYRAISCTEIEILNKQLAQDSRAGVIELNPDRPFPID
jgi:hypothetical protein